MENTRYVSKGMKFLSVIFGVLLGGFIWRCRGEGGFGGSWGLYSVGLILLMCVYHFYGNKKNMRYEMIPVGALLLGVGVTGYGTVMDQPAGLLFSDLPYQGNVIYSPIDIKSGILIFFIMGCTFLPLYSFFVGTLFSGKEYKIRHYVIAIAVFFGLSYLAKATVSHYILQWINPEQVHYAELGLADKALEDPSYAFESAKQAYMAHFGQRRWTQEIPYFENYYMSIEHVSDLLGILGLAVYALVAFKDKVTAIGVIVMNFVMGLGTTAANLLLFTVDLPTSIFADFTTPRPLAGGQWGLWEYATGATAGFVTMLFIALLPKKYTAQTEPDNSPLFGNEKFNCLFNILATGFVFGVVPARVIGIRVARIFEKNGMIEDSDTLEIILLVIIAVGLCLFFIPFVYKNLLKKKTTTLGVSPFNFALTAEPAYMLMCCILYYFGDRCVIIHLPYSEITGFSSFFYTMTNPQCIEEFTMFVTFIILVAMYIPVRKKLKKVSE